MRLLRCGASRLCSFLYVCVCVCTQSPALSEAEMKVTFDKLIEDITVAFDNLSD